MSYIDPNAPTQREPLSSEMHYDEYGRPLEPVEPVPPAPPTDPVRYVPVEPVQPVEPGEPLVPASRAWGVYRTSRIVYLVFGVIETLILIRVILRLLGANPAAAFTSLLYGLTFPFVAPFLGVFPSAGAGGSVFELSSILAIIVYALLAWVIVRIIHVAAERNRPQLRM